VVEASADTPVRPPRAILLTPITFPLAIGGATFGVLVGFAATTNGVGDYRRNGSTHSTTVTLGSLNTP
jgi:hypothetical protein